MVTHSKRERGRVEPEHYEFAWVVWVKLNEDAEVVDCGARSESIDVTNCSPGSRKEITQLIENLFN